MLRTFTIALLVAVAAYAAPLNLVFLQDPTAICNDGTPSGYYFRPSVNGSDVWIVHLQGGWWCWDEDSCNQRAQQSPAMVSSKTWGHQIEIGGMISDNATVNPNLFFANHVYLPYCTSDSWAGTRTANKSATGVASWAWQGKAVIRSTFTDLRATKGLRDGADLIFSGCSAGGQGVIVNLDMVAQLPLNVRVCSPIVLVTKRLVVFFWC
eukprot:TRINITY_DN173_c0_g5_i1.p1 TRINITY_DN173_c0_g5~~TRINITY_DN173_c0_g5_i1.p1  ORF type:complete len:209 (+),score=30.15 TRINITY_DN173_c0_g5_i1:40-666(+)